MRRVGGSRPRIRRAPCWLVIAFAALLALAACADDGPDADADDTPDMEEPEAAAEPADVEPEDSEAPDGPPAVFDEGLRGPARVTYAADVEGEMEDTFTISYDPPRTAFISGTMRIIDDGEGTTWFCEGAECQDIPSEQGFGMTQMFLGPFAMLHEELRDGLHPGVDVEESRVEIAGRQAVCITLSASRFVPESSDDTLESCVDEETGAALRWGLTYDDGERDVVEAVEFGEPREEDFVTG